MFVCIPDLFYFISGFVSSLVPAEFLSSDGADEHPNAGDIEAGIVKRLNADIR